MCTYTYVTYNIVMISYNIIQQTAQRSRVQAGAASYRTIGIVLYDAVLRRPMWPQISSATYMFLYVRDPRDTPAVDVVRPATGCGQGSATAQYGAIDALKDDLIACPECAH